MHADHQLAQHLRRSAPLGSLGIVPLGIVACLLVVLAVFWRTTWSMVQIWERSETFAHGFVVVPVFLYLLWRERETLSAIEPRPFLPALFGLAVAGVVWLLGELSASIGVTQLATMAMVPLAVWVVLGTSVVRAFAIPLAFLFFAVPFGEFLVPILMDWTADFVVYAIRLSGVPVWREANYFVIPTGYWSVVEACSGLRYLIASLMVGCLYAYLSYRSVKRRAMFIAASIAVPIVANWLRAYIIVMLGHLTNNRLATGIDHVIYGWVFFGVVMVLLFAIGARWREDWPSRSSEGDAALARVPETPTTTRRSLAGAALAAAILVAMWPPVLASVEHASVTTEARLTPVPAADGWIPVAARLTPWRPEYLAPAATLAQSFENDGARVGLYIALYRSQTAESKAVSSQNKLVRTTNREWRLAPTGATPFEIGGAKATAETAVIHGQQRLAVWEWYWIDGHVTSNDTAAKLYQVLSLIRGRGDSTARVVIYTPIGREDLQADALLRRFASSMAPRIHAMLASAGGD